MSRAKKSHYDTLGVKRDAKPEEIKRAYRRKAKAAHPDVGGDAESMADLNRAFDCLSDPQRRLLYDSTGQDSTRPIEEEIRSIVFQVFADGLEREVPDCLGHARKILTAKRGEFEKQKAQVIGKESKLQSRRDKISVKSGENLFHLLIDQQLANLAGAIHTLDHNIRLIDAAQKILKSYKTTEEAAQAMTVVWSFGSMSATTSSS